MKALQCVELGGVDKLEINEVSSPDVGPGQVLIDVKAASVNFPDVLMIQGLYQFQPPLPFTPGGEAAGIVEKIGEGVESLKEGDKVFAMTGMGAFAEKIVAPEGSVMPIPESMDYETAAALSMTYGTTLYALKQRANLKAGETLLFLEPQVGLVLLLLIWAKLWELKLLQLHHLKKKLICAFNMVLMKDSYIQLVTYQKISKKNFQERLKRSQEVLEPMLFMIQ